MECFNRDVSGDPLFNDWPVDEKPSCEMCLPPCNGCTGNCTTVSEHTDQTSSLPTAKPTIRKRQLDPSPASTSKITPAPTCAGRPIPTSTQAPATIGTLTLMDHCPYSASVVEGCPWLCRVKVLPRPFCAESNHTGGSIGPWPAYCTKCLPPCELESKELVAAPGMSGNSAEMPKMISPTSFWPGLETQGRTPLDDMNDLNCTWICRLDPSPWFFCSDKDNSGKDGPNGTTLDCVPFLDTRASPPTPVLGRRITRAEFWNSSTDTSSCTLSPVDSSMKSIQVTTNTSSPVSEPSEWTITDGMSSVYTVEKTMDSMSSVETVTLHPNSACPSTYTADGTGVNRSFRCPISIANASASASMPTITTLSKRIPAICVAVLPVGLIECSSCNQVGTVCSYLCAVIASPSPYLHYCEESDVRLIKL